MEEMSAGISVQLDIKKLYAKLCPKCQKLLKELIRESISDQLVEQVIGKEPKGGG